MNFDIWSIIASILAAISALSAYRSSRLAKKALALTQRQFDSKRADFDLYIIDSYRWHLDKIPKRKFLLFNIAVKNKSETSCTFNANLEIEYINADNSVSRIILEHNPDLLKEMPNNQISLFPKDLRLEGRDSVSKWFIFEQPIELFQGQRIAEYSIKATDTSGNFSTAVVTIMKDLVK